MAEGQMLFSLDLTRFQEIRKHPWFNLQHEFNTKGVPLSQSLLVWSEESGNTQLLADFKNEKAYEIKIGSQTVEVSERSSEAEHPFTLEDTETILNRLKSAQGTDQGFIDLLKKLNLDELDLEGLKRSDLSASRLQL